MRIEEIVKIVNEVKEDVNAEVYEAIRLTIKRYLRRNHIKASKDDLQALIYEASKLLEFRSPYV